jgi:hypothetical protein
MDIAVIEISFQQMLYLSITCNTPYVLLCYLYFIWTHSQTVCSVFPLVIFLEGGDLISVMIFD